MKNKINKKIQNKKFASFVKKALEWKDVKDVFSKGGDKLKSLISQIDADPALRAKVLAGTGATVGLTAGAGVGGSYLRDTLKPSGRNTPKASGLELLQLAGKKGDESVDDAALKFYDLLNKEDGVKNKASKAFVNASLLGTKPTDSVYTDLQAKMKDLWEAQKATREAASQLGEYKPYKPEIPGLNINL